MLQLTFHEVIRKKVLLCFSQLTLEKAYHKTLKKVYHNVNWNFFVQCAA
jgi:hypothetical protein